MTRQIALRTVLLLVCCTAAALSGCEETEPQATLGTAAPIVRMSPSVGGLGMTLQLELRGVNTQWEQGQVSVDLGADIFVAGVTVNGPNHANADLQIAENALLGFRDVVVSFLGADGEVDEYRFEDDEGFLVESGGISLSPARARLGETLQIEITGYNTILQAGSTWADFGDGIFVNWVEVIDETHARASVSVDQRSDPGLHDVVVFNGPNGYTLMDGFFVDRKSICVEIDPDHGNQGEVLPFVVRGCDTHWEDTGGGIPVPGGASADRDTLVDLGYAICINEFWPDCQDQVEPGGVVAVSTPTLAQGTMRISNAAPPGFYDVRAYVIERTDLNEDGLIEVGEWNILEEVILHEGFEVREVPLDCNDNPGVSFGFSVSRNINNDTCDVQESVGASAVFFTPLDPPCGPPPMDPIFPFDIDYIRNPPQPADCPSPRTCDAGPYVYLVGDLNTITLARQENTFTGEISYALEAPLTLDDYKFGYQPYDLVADGSEDPTQIPAFTAEDVLYTLPSDWELVEPSFCNNFTQDPAEDMLVRWTPAQTYDVAGMAMSFSTSDNEGIPWMAITLPWDDGEHMWPKELFPQIPEGGGYFSISTGVSEPKWFLDFGNGPVGVENQGSSGLSYRGFMLLRASDSGGGE